MKKYYILLIILLPFLGIAQTITQNDLPVAGSAYQMGVDTTYTGSILPGGTGQTWNYSSLVSLYADTNIFLSASSTPYAVNFPGSNLSVYNASSDSYIYYTSNSNGFFVDGIGTVNQSISYNPPQLFIPVPFSYGDTRNNISRLQIDTAVVDTTTGNTTNYRTILRTESLFECDGSGSLTIPSGSHPNVLRIKQTIVEYDSLLFQLLGVWAPLFSTVSQTVDYRFVTSGLQNNYLLGIEADSLGTTGTRSEYYISDITSSISPVSDISSLRLYPNPASSFLSVKFQGEKSAITIYDSMGRKTISTEISADEPLDIRSLAEGIYYYEIVVNDKLQKGNFTIKH